MPASRARCASSSTTPSESGRGARRGRRRSCCRRATTSAWMRAPRRSARSTRLEHQHGRALGADEAVAGRIERARGRLGPRRGARRPRPFMVVKPAMISGWMQASPPPASTTSASPRRISSAASMTACAPVEQAEMGARFVPAQRRACGDRAARDVGQALRQEPRRDALPAALAHDLVLFHHRVEAADRGAEEHAEARRVVDDERGVVGGLARGGQRQQHVVIDAPRLLGAGDGHRGRSP